MFWTDVGEQYCLVPTGAAVMIRSITARRKGPDILLMLGRCSLNPVEARVESAWFQLLTLTYDEQLSNVAFDFSLRRYIT